MKCSHVQILFYDADQSVKPADISPSSLNNLAQTRNVINIPLKSQLRCLGGDDYIAYVKAVLNGTASEPHGPFENYDLRFYEDVDQMMDEINRLDRECDLCCGVAGYAWKWVTQNQPKDTPLRDITIGRGYIWNRTATDWINSDRLPNEIGCIHTVQGYDLNYVGVIFGTEIIYDPVRKRVDVVQKNYRDNHGRAVGGDMEALREYIINIYCTLMTRGIRGAFVYVCDPELRKYLRKYFA